MKPPSSRKSPDVPDEELTEINDRESFGSGAGLSHLKPADKVAVAYLIVITGLVIVSSSRIELWPLFGAGHLLLIAIIVLIARSMPLSDSSGEDITRSRAASVRSIFVLVRGWYPVVLIPITYKELSYLIPFLHHRDFDTNLAAIDFHFFGVHPTVWLERFSWPVLTEVLQLTYSTYYFLPIVLGITLWRQKPVVFHFWVFVVVVGFYLSYLGYISVPATGPRFLPSILQSQTKPLTGVWLFSTVRGLLDRAEGITRDCFPSGHTELTLLVLYYACVFQRRVFWWLLPIGTGIIVSTVYLRYHYVVDVVAGALLAIGIILVAKPAYRVLGG